MAQRTADRRTYSDGDRPTGRAVPRPTPGPDSSTEPVTWRQRFSAALDVPLLLIVAGLLGVGMMMIYSTTFDWSYYEYGDPTAIFTRQHLLNLAVALAAMLFFTIVDYRFWKPFAVLFLFVAIGSLIAVLLFGDTTFGARRALIAGRFQPGELAEFTVVIYMAAWLGARQTQVDRLFGGLVPFIIIIAAYAGLVAAQPDLSSAVIIALTASGMFFLAGASMLHLAVLAGLGTGAAAVLLQVFPYAQDRVSTFSAALADPTLANYHTQQAIIAFLNGGWGGVGLGESRQKFFLPAPHTDSIFAVIGEELGVIGAALVVMLFVALVVRGFQISRRAIDPFGSLLVVGFTLWIALKALLNIAVMTALIPSSGLPLPFISYGGSSLFVLLSGIGIILSVNRIAINRQNQPNRRDSGTHHDRGWGDRRTRLPSTRRRGDAAGHSA
jgi:cell division protein FtsW